MTIISEISNPEIADGSLARVARALSNSRTVEME